MHQGQAEFVEAHGPQLYGSGVPLSLWPRVMQKVCSDTLDAGAVFQLAALSDESGDVVDNKLHLVATVDLPAESDVWLVDHAWTFRARDARRTLSEQPDLFRRLLSMFGLPSETTLSDDAFWTELWRQVGTYRLASDTTLDEENCWYVMDEVGSAVDPCGRHESPAVAMCPFLYLPTKSPMTLMWCERDVEAGEVLQARRSQHLLAKGDDYLFVHDLLWSDSEVRETAEAQCRSFAAAWRDKMATFARPQRETPWFGHPPTECFASRLPPVRRVFADVDFVRHGLALDSRYVVVDSPDTADVIWQTAFEEGLHERIAIQFPKAAFVSQFRHEREFCNKATMAKTMQAEFGQPSWLPVTFDGSDQLPTFCGEFLMRQAEQRHNLWIVKPPAMARSMDMTISNDLTRLLRLSETGPKVYCEYIHNPCLFRGRKFDVRFIVAVRCLHPVPELFLYDRYWPRFALLPYGLQDFDVYERHWTVMNYARKEDMLDLLCEDFEVEFDAKYGANRWQGTVMPQVRRMTFEAFQAIAAAVPQSAANGSGLHSIAIYGLDVLINDQLEPKLLEITFSPDCERALRHEPRFACDIFAALLEGVASRCTRVSSPNT